jgi:hypothetical protein
MMEWVMRNYLQYAYPRFLAIVVVSLLANGIGHAQVRLINMTPQNRSCESNQDSEPNLAVNPANTNQIAGSAFTPGNQIDCLDATRTACPTNLAPIFVSTDGGGTWNLNCIVPSNAGGMTSDITLRFGSNTNNLYAGILRQPGFLRLNILRTNDFAGTAGMTLLVDRNNVDQPYVQAITVAGNDRVYVGDNDFGGPNGQTATIDQSLDGTQFNTLRIETRVTAGQDGPPIRTAIHPNGVIYAAFYGWRTRVGNFSPNATITSDVVVVRDNNGGTGTNPFTALVDTDGLAGVRVAQNRTIPWANTSQPGFGQERFVGSNITIAVDPSRSSTVYIAWAARVGTTDYTLHVRRSLDFGATWSGDLRTITNATNPALAINDAGTVGFLYQQLTASGTSQRWVTHVERTNDAFVNIQDLVLANVPANAPPAQFTPYIGDYVHLKAIGTTFYGIFSANNTPDNSNFPNGVIYQRNANFTTRTLLSTDNATSVPVSIDPFFFSISSPPVLTVNMELVHPDHNHLRLFNLLIDGVVVRANINGGGTGPQQVSPGIHRVSETGGTATPIGAFHVVIGGHCAPDGTVNLSAGQSKTCTITNFDNFGGCPTQRKCCEPGTGEQGCQQCVLQSQQCP